MSAESLVEACRAGHADSVRKILSAVADSSARVDEQLGEWGRSGLYWAAREGRTEILRLLLDSGGSVDSTDKDGTTPLIAAAYFGHGDAARLLLESGADAAQTVCGRNAAAFARANGYPALADAIDRFDLRSSSVHASRYPACGAIRTASAGSPPWESMSSVVTVPAAASTRWNACSCRRNHWSMRPARCVIANSGNHVNSPTSATSSLRSAQYFLF